jgi:putative transposase
MVTPAAKREAVAHLAGVHEMSERRACRLIGCQRMTVRYAAVSCTQFRSSGSLAR